jgi:hypothetical protein
MKETVIMVNKKGWSRTLSLAFVLMLAACGTTPLLDQSNTSISEAEAQAAVTKLQSNAGLKAASLQDLSALNDQQLTDAWSGLSEREQAAAKLFLEPSSEETGSSNEDGELSAQAAGCWYQTWWRYAKNIFGKKLWQYNQRLDWCSNGRYLTSASREVWGETFWIGWRFKGERNRWIYGGRGHTGYRAVTQGEFELGTGPWDVQHYYPRIDNTVRR